MLCQWGCWRLVFCSISVLVLIRLFFALFFLYMVLPSRRIKQFYLHFFSNTLESWHFFIKNFCGISTRRLTCYTAETKKLHLFIFSTTLWKRYSPNSRSAEAPSHRQLRGCSTVRIKSASTPRWRNVCLRRKTAFVLGVTLTFDV